MFSPMNQEFEERNFLTSVKLTVLSLKKVRANLLCSSVALSWSRIFERCIFMCLFWMPEEVKANNAEKLAAKPLKAINCISSGAGGFCNISRAILANG